jgi:hypothetical protein
MTGTCIRGLPRLGRTAFGRGGLPDLENGACAHEDAVVGEPGMGQQHLVEDDAAFLVRINRIGFTIDGGG